MVSDIHFGFPGGLERLTGLPSIFYWTQKKEGGKPENHDINNSCKILKANEQPLRSYKYIIKDGKPNKNEP